MTHQQAKSELDRGTPPEVICATCPWDRFCVEPPKMTSRDIERLVSDAEEKEKAQDPTGARMPVQTLLTSLMFAGKDTSGSLCPVFALRLRGPDGRQIADGMRTSMQAWSEPS